LFCREKELSQSKHATQNINPPSLSQIFCIAQLVQSYLKGVEVLGSNLHFLGGFFISAHSRTSSATSTTFFKKP